MGRSRCANGAAGSASRRLVADHGVGSTGRGGDEGKRPNQYRQRRESVGRPATAFCRECNGGHADRSTVLTYRNHGTPQPHRSTIVTIRPRLKAPASTICCALRTPVTSVQSRVSARKGLKGPKGPQIDPGGALRSSDRRWRTGPGAADPSGCRLVRERGPGGPSGAHENLDALRRSWGAGQFKGPMPQRGLKGLKDAFRAWRTK